MRFYLVSDNVDTQVGMRLAGVSGVVVHEEKEIKDAIKEAIKDENIGIILVTTKIVEKCRDFIYDIKLNTPKPLIVEISDRHNNSTLKGSISKYIKDAIGIEI